MFKKIQAVWSDDPEDENALIYFKEITINTDNVSEFYRIDDTNEN